METPLSSDELNEVFHTLREQIDRLQLGEHITGLTFKNKANKKTLIDLYVKSLFTAVMAEKYLTRSIDELTIEKAYDKVVALLQEKTGLIKSTREKISEIVANK